jgi:ppGpp synthetase/RelA/SpoT-type nucleotidyltranferase
VPSDDLDLHLRSFKVHAPAQQALREVLNTLQSGDTDVFYAIRSRVKPVKKIIEKTTRKRNSGKASYTPEDITDVAGLRVVTLFREDVIEALKIFLRLIKHEGAYSTISPFVKGELKEKIIFTTASVGDPEAITSRLRSVFEAAGFPLKDSEVTQVNTGYSSIHLIAFCSVRHDGDIAKVPIEIQIRTVFEDAWGEIDHKLRYSLNRNRSSTADSMLESWQPHLNVLKAFTDGCGQYAGIIKNQAIDARTRPEIEPFVPVDNPAEALQQIGDADSNLRARFEEAYVRRADAMELARLNGASSPATVQAFLEAADLFSSIQEMVSTATFSLPRHRDAAQFFSMMERAFCLLSTGKKASIDEAIKIYSEAQEFSPNSVVVYYRYAQALTKLGEYDASIAKYIKAESLLSTDKYVPSDHWIHTLIPRNLGYVTWRKSLLIADDETGRETRLKLLVEAYRHTERAAALSTGLTLHNKLRNANNALYYAVEYIALLGKPTESSEIQEQDVRPSLDLLESNVVLATATPAQLNWIDTLCRAHALFGNIEKAVLAAERVEHLLSAPTTYEPEEGDGKDEQSAEHNSSRSYYATTSHLNDRERDMLDHALWVLRKHGPGPEREQGTEELRTR